LVLESHWRLLSASQAANGIIIVSWTTAVIVVALSRVGHRLKRIEHLDESRPDS
jgi:hypothetical protein